MPRRNDIAKILIMGSGTQRRLAFAMCFLFLIALHPPAHACTLSHATVHVSSDFRVIVSHGSTPIPGIQVEVYDEGQLSRQEDSAEWKPVLTLVTSRDGAAEVKNLEKGLYLVETRGPGGGSAVYAEVSDSSLKKQNAVNLAWPFSWDSEILNVRALTGDLKSNNPWKPFENLHVELWTAGAGSPLAAEDTGPNGHFQFAESRPGIYILRIRGQQKAVDDNSQIKGEIAVRLSPAAADSREPLSLYLGMTSCGITYNSCPTPGALALPSRRLQLNDPLGAVIANAKYRVLDPAGAELTTGSTGSDGIAELPSELKGNVTLVVAGPGFTVFSLPLDLLPPDDPASYLVVEMAVQGYGGERCSTARLEKNATPQ